MCFIHSHFSPRLLQPFVFCVSMYVNCKLLRGARIGRIFLVPLLSTNVIKLGELVYLAICVSYFIPQHFSRAVSPAPSSSFLYQLITSGFVRAFLFFSLSSAHHQPFCLRLPLLFSIISSSPAVLSAPSSSFLYHQLITSGFVCAFLFFSLSSAHHQLFCLRLPLLFSIISSSPAVLSAPSSSFLYHQLITSGFVCAFLFFSLSSAHHQRFCLRLPLLFSIISSSPAVLSAPSSSFLYHQLITSCFVCAFLFFSLSSAHHQLFCLRLPLLFSIISSSPASTYLYIIYISSFLFAPRLVVSSFIFCDIPTNIQIAYDLRSLFKVEKTQ